MIIYLFKFVACSALLLILYHLALEKEKMPTFNRFYLLFSVVFSGLAPLFTFELSITAATQGASLVIERTQQFYPARIAEVLPSSPILFSEAITNANEWDILCAIYGVISLALLMRFGKNLFIFWRDIRTHTVAKKGAITLVLMPQNISPYSFGNYVFVNQKEYEREEIEPEILLHEQAHISQRHTWDIIFVELVLAFGWWNPALWLYRKAIMLNHEFLADDWVIKKAQNVSAYQYLLLHKISKNNALQLASSFNYLTTKRRFKMMNKITPLARVRALQTVTTLLFGVLLLVVGDISFAQSASTAVPKATTQANPTQEGVSQVLMAEYQKIVDKNTRKGVKNGKEWRVLEMPNEADRARLETIFRAMSKEQQEAQVYIMHPPLPPFKRIIPTEKEFEGYKDAKIYGVWIDDKKVSNFVLDTYKAADFSQVFISKLYKNAQPTTGYKYKYQLDLMTNAHYEKHRAEWLADKRYFLTSNMNKLK